MSGTQGGEVERARPRHCPDCGTPCGQGAFCVQCGSRLTRQPDASKPLQDGPAEHQDADSSSRAQPAPESTVADAGTAPPPMPNVPAGSPPHAPESAAAPAAQPPAGARRSQVSCRRTGKPDFTVRFETDELTIGQASDCDIVLPGDQYASRLHARLIRVDGRVTLEDLGSSNGTFVRVRQAVELKAGDEALIGTSILKLEENA